MTVHARTCRLHQVLSWLSQAGDMASASLGLVQVFFLPLTIQQSIKHQSPALLRTRAMRITSLHKTSRQTAISRRSIKRKANTGSQERQLCLRNKNRELPTSRSAANGVSMFVKVDHWTRKLLLCQSNEGHEFTASVSAASTSSTKATLKECL